MVRKKKNTAITNCIPVADPASESSAVEKDFLAKREFSFTMEGDIYIRYLSFRDEDDIRSWIQKKQPHKIDIGAMYTHPVPLYANTIVSCLLMLVSYSQIRKQQSRRVVSTPNNASSSLISTSPIMIL